MNNDLLLINKNERYSLNLNVVGVTLGDTFALENIGDYYTSLNDDKLHREIELAKVDGRISQSNDTTWIKADIIGFDAVLYDVLLWYAVPVPIDTISLNFNDVSFENHCIFVVRQIQRKSPTFAPTDWEKELLAQRQACISPHCS